MTWEIADNEHFRKGYLMGKKILYANNLLKLWNEQRITDEEYEGIQRLIQSSNIEDVMIADACIRTLHSTRDYYAMRKKTRKQMHKIHQKVFDRLKSDKDLRS